MREHLNNEVGKFMLNKVFTTCENYQTDLIHDIELLTTGEKHKTFYWCARECGTNIVSFYDFNSRDNAGKVEYLEVMQDVVRFYASESWYKIENAYSEDYKNVTIKEITYKDIQKELENLKQLFT